MQNHSKRHKYLTHKNTDSQKMSSLLVALKNINIYNYKYTQHI